MRRFLALSLATTLLGGCSCQGSPAAAAPTVPDAGQATRPAPPPALALPQEPTAFDKAMALHAQARARGESGDYPEALRLLAQARELAPEWLQPRYDTALTYLLMGDAAKALPVYEEVDKLAPQGFSDTKRVLECLRREQSGRVPQGTFRKFIDVSRVRDPKAYEEGMRELARSAPRFYPAWRELIPYGKDLDEQERLLEKTLALQPDALSRGELLVYKATLLRRRGKEAQARALLQSLVDDPKSLPGTVTDAKEALSLTLPP